MYSDFTTDFEKMVDFCFIGREDFLNSYSYLDRDDWEATFCELLEKCFGELNNKQKAYINYILDYHNTHDECCYPVCLGENNIVSDC